MRHRNSGNNPSVHAPSCCPIQQESAIGARLLALHPSRPAVRARGDVAWELPALPSQDETPGVAIRRASRAPPRCSV
ncbi:MAG TPA: hypothetical protein VLR69_12055 [Thermoanaerobaculia bacterium]|nr:hypothetical protein [Thermoanaerobaculia bacterium]